MPSLSSRPIKRPIKHIAAKQAVLAINSVNGLQAKSKTIAPVRRPPDWRLQAIIFRQSRGQGGGVEVARAWIEQPSSVHRRRLVELLRKRLSLEVLLREL
jgi:hypothetical protein